ncbi:hypothetical protein ACGFYQ_31485 [Streptomyces sp. NPDC048258]|uniref:hypothetical protein n=1 Tax=Streptomyces sp. NPDC048258 TaxID=3365527 RepID=UPI003714B09F
MRPLPASQVEDWFWNIDTGKYYEGPQLPGPTSHPASQPTPGPRDKVPADWPEQLH